MAPNSSWKPYTSLCDAPTNLKEAIDWVLRVTGRDGKELNKDTECICGLAAAVTDLLQSVELEYHGYQGDVKDTDSTGKNNKGASQQDVTDHLNELFSLVQGLGGTAVVRTYIDQLAQVLSALVGWSSIKKCENGGCGGGRVRGKCSRNIEKNGHGKMMCCCHTNGKCKDSPGCCKGTTNNKNGVCANGCCSHGGKECVYLEDVKENTPCKECGCMKWDDPDKSSNEGHHLGRRCTRCKDSGGSGQKPCECSTPGSACQGADKCKCAKEGKCCKCCCTSCLTCKKDAKCVCTTEESIILSRSTYVEVSIERYMSSYLKKNGTITTWINVGTSTDRSKCAQILLGSVCLIWSGLTYMYWTGRQAHNKSSPRWNNHILDGSGLDDGTLSQWLQALGFPREMLNNSGPGNRMDAVITETFTQKFLMGFQVPSGSGARDDWDNTARKPAGMNYAGFVHTIHRDSFNNEAKVFPNGTSSGNTDQVTETDQHKRGALFKLYILSCAYFTGLQKKNTTESTPRTPRTIREILYWLSALPYSKGYKGLLHYGKERLKEVLKKPDGSDSSSDTPKLSFLQEGRSAPITVHEYNLFAHFQAVTQYCPLVLIGIQGGIHSTNTTTPAIHSLYANSHFSFTYPTVPIQAYNQVVHYIRALFYQLYFLRKQCAIKVTCGGKWRECRYGSGVLGKDVVSWMCMGCSPMEHDRNYRVKEMGKILKGVKEWKGKKEVIEKLKELLEKIGDVVVQLGNAQERLDRGNDVLKGVKGALNKVFNGVYPGKNGGAFKTVLQEVLDKLVKLVDGLEKAGGLTDDGQTSQAINNAKKALETAKEAVGSGNAVVDGCKNAVSAAIDGLHKVLEIFKKWMTYTSSSLDGHKEALLDATSKLKDICTSPKCHNCVKHSTKCGQPSQPSICQTCLQPTTTGVPSPLQAFLDDRLPGFSCNKIPEVDSPDYPPAASHLGHCNGSGQCCPLPMGFRGHFQQGITQTGKRLYGILYFFSNENMMQSCVYTLVRVTAALSATTPQVLGDVFGFFRGGVGNPVEGENKEKRVVDCKHSGDPSQKKDDQYFCGWCASGLRDEVKKIEWIPKEDEKTPYRGSVGEALIKIKGDKGGTSASPQSTPSNLSTLTDSNHYVSPLTGELYTAVSATFGHVYLQWVLYLSDALQWGLESLSQEFKQIECRGCRGCDPNKCRKGEHGKTTGDSKSTALCTCGSIVSCTGVLPVLYRHGFSYGNPFNLEGFRQKDGNKEEHGQFDIEDNRKNSTKKCHEFLESLKKVIEDKNKQEGASQQDQDTTHPLTNLLSEVGKLQYDIRLPWIFVLTLAWLVAVLYLAFGAIWPLDWTHMRSHWLRGGAHQWQCMWYKVMTGRKGMELVEYFGRK